MPKQSATSSVFQKLGRKGVEAFNAHKSDETVYSAGGNLPDGIEGGIAQLSSITFGVFKDGPNKGKDYFLAAGVVVSPREFQGLRIEGLRTSIGPEPLCDTPQTQGKRKTLADHLGWVLNELRKLGVDTSELDASELDAAVNALLENKPHFRFRTWKGKPTAQYPNPRVNHSWEGVCEYAAVIGETDGDIVDETPTVESESPDSTEAEPEVTGSEDLPALVELAESGDSESQDRLKTLALEAGISEEDIDGAASWADVASSIEAAGNPEDGESSEETSWVPEVGETVLYRALDPKTKKQAKKATEHDVTKVFLKSETVHLNCSATKKPVLGPDKKPLAIAWSDLNQLG